MNDILDTQAVNHRSYGIIAALWNETVEKNYDFSLHERCRELFIRHLSGKRILEVGCGLGWDSDFFAKAGYDVTATDFQEAFVALAGSRNPDVTASVMDMMNPSHFPEPFHGIYGFASFLHVPREKSGETLRGLASLLGETGVLFLHHVGSAKGFPGYTQDNLLIENNPVYCTCHSEDEMRELLSEAGFSSILFHCLPKWKTNALTEKYGLYTYQVIAIRGREGM